MPQSGIAIVRQCLSAIPSVTDSWFEWSFEDGAWHKTLVVMVDVNTDPQNSSFSLGTLHAISAAVKGVDLAQTTMQVERLKVVPTR